MSNIIDILVPDEQEGTKAIVRSWLVAIGDEIALDSPLVELETDKVTQEVPAPDTGVLTEILLDTDDEAVPGALLGRMDIGATKEQAHSSAIVDTSDVPLAAVATNSEPKNSHTAMGLSPAVRRAVKQHEVDPADVVGTGRNGRITRADVDDYVAKQKDLPAAEQASSQKSATLQTSSTPVSGSAGGITNIPHDRMRKAIAENMLNSVTVAPHVTAVFECDFTAIIAHRKQHKVLFEKDGAKLTFTAYIIAACAQAMRAAPAVNSRWHDDHLDIFSDINIGVGTALGDKGLIVPVVKKVQDLSLLGIAQHLTDLTARARDNKLGGSDVRDGTFTISNHGVSGSLVATPIIINQPQSAILGVGKLEKRVVVRTIDGADTIQIRPMCFVSLTIDHRALDGHQTNTWLTKFVEALESWPQS